MRTIDPDEESVPLAIGVAYSMVQGYVDDQNVPVILNLAFNGREHFIKMVHAHLPAAARYEYLSGIRDVSRLAHVAKQFGKSFEERLRWEEFPYNAAFWDDRAS